MTERQPRFDHDASQTAIHEAGHALERYLVHGTTGAIKPAPLPDKEAGAESEPLPDCLKEPDPNTPGEERIVDPPYSPNQRERLVKEIKTTLAGSVAEGLYLDRDPLEVLEDPAQESDGNYSWGIAKKLWDYPDYHDEMRHLADEVYAELDSRWKAIVAIGEAYDAAAGLSADDLETLLESHGITPLP